MKMLTLTMPIGSSPVNTRRYVPFRKLPKLSNIILLRNSISKIPSCGGGKGKGKGNGNGNGKEGNSSFGWGDYDGRSNSDGSFTAELLALLKDILFYEDGKTPRVPLTGKYWLADIAAAFFTCWLFDMKTHFIRDFFKGLRLIAELSKDNDDFAALSDLDKWRHINKLPKWRLG